MDKNFFKNFIQVAGIIDQDEADLMIECGVKFLGFPLRLPVNKVDLTENQAKAIIQKLIPPNYGVVISYCSTANESIELCDKLNSNIIQLHGEISYLELKKLRTAKPDLMIIKSLVINNNNNESLITSVKMFDEYVDAYITDTFDPTTGASGATGKTHDWSISKKIISTTNRPVILAGGLNPNNVYDSIIKVKPAGVDVHTGVENPEGRKDKTLLNKFVSEANRAFEELKNENHRI